jgi:hypothetical protein
MNEPLRIRYRFDLPDGSQKTLDFSFDAATFKLQNPTPPDPPFWTELKFNRCSNCPLKEEEHPHCPAALQMTSALEPLKALVSFDTVGVTVLQPERRVYAETTVQQAMSSVFGLIMATAGCPWTDRLRPMARFHLPFAGETETLYRSVSMYLLSRGCGGEHGSRTQRACAARFVYTAAASRSRALARRAAAVVHGLANEVISADLTYRDGL